MDPITATDPFRDEQSSLHAFSQQILASERRRTLLLAIVMAITLLVLCVATFVPGAAGPVLREQFQDAFVPGAAFIASTVIYELIVWTLLGRSLKAKTDFPAVIRWAYTFIDTSIASIATILVAQLLSPLVALQGNNVLVYFFFIILTTLQLDARLCIFAGAVAAVEYAAIAMHYLPALQPGSDKVIIDPGHHIARAGMLLINALFAPMVDSVNRHRGIVNKFLGDGFMAIFGAPLAGGEHTRNAIAASVEILRGVEALARSGKIPPTQVGIGLHAGAAMTGNVGSALRKEYTVIGSVVNLASRIESLNKQFGSNLLVSEQVWSGQTLTIDPPVTAKDLGLVEVRGQAEAVRLYQLIYRRESESPA